MQRHFCAKNSAGGGGVLKVTKVAIISAISICGALSATVSTFAADPADFDPRSLEWFQNNTGYNPAALNPALAYTASFSIPTQDDPVILDGLSFKHPSQPVDCANYPDFQYRNRDNDVTIRNSYLEGSIRQIENVYGGAPGVTTPLTRGSMTIEHSTWGDWANQCKQSRAIEGTNLNIRNNYITAREDGIIPVAGYHWPNTIEYNWLRGPGAALKDSPAVPEGNHSDGIQFWREGYTSIHRNRIEGWSNSAILVKSDAEPYDGAPQAPISNISITENFFGSEGVTWKYLYVLPANASPTQEWGQRPRYVTITDNWFESKPSSPPAEYLDPTNPAYVSIMNPNSQIRWPIDTASIDTCDAGAELTAMFVRTEAERNEGIARQNAHPEVIAMRQANNYDAMAADARAWIVWDNNRYAEDGSEVRPRDLCPASDRGWYSLAEERSAFPLDTNSTDLIGITALPFSLSPTFSPDITSYRMQVPHHITSLDSLSYAPAHPQATAQATGNTNFAVGENTIQITVTAEDGASTKTYQILVTRLEDDTPLTEDDAPAVPSTGYHQTSSVSPTVSSTASLSVPILTIATVLIAIATYGVSRKNKKRI